MYEGGCNTCYALDRNCALLVEHGRLIEPGEPAEPAQDVFAVALHLADGVILQVKRGDLRDVFAELCHILKSVDEIVVQLQSLELLETANAFNPLDEIEAEIEDAQVVQR